MPRTNNAEAARRRRAILAHCIDGVGPAKVIAAIVGVSLNYTRNVFWSEGYRAMLVLPEERAHLLKRRRKVAAVQKSAA